MAQLKLSLFGVFAAAVDGRLVTGFESVKVRALLAYLAVERDQAHARELLATLLWPELPTQAALTNLRSALANLRDVLGDRQVSPPLLLITRDTLRLNPVAAVWSDVTAFLDLLEPERSTTMPAQLRLEQAIALYRGDFLEGFSSSGSASFEEWLTLTREQLARRLVEALRQLADVAEQAADYRQAELYARRLLAHEPLDEATHQLLMRALALTGRRSAALAYYERCRRLLSAELGVEPVAETQALYAAIRDETLIARAKGDALPQAPPAQPPQLPLRFVAREAELARLHAALSAALAGHGCVLCLMGSPGSGKTVLAEAFVRQALAHPTLIAAVGGCNAYGGLGDPYLPFRQILAQLTGDHAALATSHADDSTLASRQAALVPTVVQALLDEGPDLIERFVVGAGLRERALRLRVGSTAWPSGLEQRLAQAQQRPTQPQLQQVDLFEQYVRVLTAVTQRHPLLLILDDLQWIDAGSASLLLHLGRQLTRNRILVIGAYRPEEVAQGRAGQPHPLATVLPELQRVHGERAIDLDHGAGQAFVDALIDTEPNQLGPAFRRQLHQHTAGHALFTVELLRGLQEQGQLERDLTGRLMETPTLRWDIVPARVEAVIAERVARLSERERTLVQMASVEGEVFTAEVLARIGALDVRDVTAACSGALSRQHQLVHAERVEWLGTQRLSRYRFRHILFQTYFYQSLDPIERSQLHAAVGQALEDLYGVQVRNHASTLAHHFAAAGMAPAAMTYHRWAGDEAVRLFAYPAAIQHYKQALDLIATQAAGAARDQEELQLRVALGVPLLAAYGFSDVRLKANYERAYALTDQMHPTPELFRVLAGLKSYYDLQLRLRTALDLAERMVRLAADVQEPTLELVARHHLNVTRLYLGEAEVFVRDLPLVLGGYDSEQHRGLAFELGFDPQVASLAHAGWAYRLLGAADAARQASAMAVARARELDHPFVLAFACFFAAYTHCYLREVASARSYAEKAATVAQQAGIAFWLAAADTIVGWAMAQDGQVDEGLAHFVVAQERLQAMGAELGRVQGITLHAELSLLGGRVHEGLAALDEGIEVAEAAHYRMVLPDLYRWRDRLAHSLHERGARRS